MADLSLKNIIKIYPNGVKAVDNFNLEIADKEFVIFVGPSGCGKTTTLRMIAGLEVITEGEIKISDKVVNEVHPKDRDIAMVFQNYALYPHMTVFQNMAFSLKMKKMKKNEINKRVNEAAKTLEIQYLLDRKPKMLSGGQRQRVALGRAIVRHPAVFLMDEPLSNLDAKLRVQMRMELSKLHNKIKATFIYVTHDQVEAMTMGTQIVVMNLGVIQQVAPPVELYEKPANKFVAGFIGSPQMNLFEAEVLSNNGTLMLKFADTEMILPKSKAKKLMEAGYIGKKVIFGIRPEDLYDLRRSFEETVSYIKNESDGDVVSIESSLFKIKVDLLEILGADKIVYFEYGGIKASAKVSHANFALEDSVEILMDTEKIHLFDIDTEKSILY